jgi:aminobenzoyl-glutamate utilization protein B
VSENLVNETMDRAMQAVLDEIGGVPFDAEDRAYADAIRATLGPEDLVTPWRIIAEKPRPDTPLCDWVVPFRPGGAVMVGSTDVGDVTWAVPTTEVLISTLAIGTPGHSWQVTAQGKSPAAHKGMTHAGLAMARLAQRLIDDPALLAAAQREHAGRLSETPYVCPIPADVPVPAG